MQTPGLLVVLTEGSVPGVRQVFLDGRHHPSDPSPTWLGHSIGTWDGVSAPPLLSTESLR